MLLCTCTYQNMPNLLLCLGTLVPRQNPKVELVSSHRMLSYVGVIVVSIGYTSRWRFLWELLTEHAV